MPDLLHVCQILWFDHNDTSIRKEHLWHGSSIYWGTCEECISVLWECHNFRACTWKYEDEIREMYVTKVMDSLLSHVCKKVPDPEPVAASTAIIYSVEIGNNNDTSASGTDRNDFVKAAYPTLNHKTMFPFEIKICAEYQDMLPRPRLVCLTNPVVCQAH